MTQCRVKNEVYIRLVKKHEKNMVPEGGGKGVLESGKKVSRVETMGVQKRIMFKGEEKREFFCHHRKFFRVCTNGAGAPYSVQVCRCVLRPSWRGEERSYALDSRDPHPPGGEKRHISSRIFCKQFGRHHTTSKDCVIMHHISNLTVAHQLCKQMLRRYTYIIIY